METFTVQATYEKGVLKLKKKLNLPEHSLVEIRVRTTRGSRKRTAFASLLGVWEHLSERETAALEKALAGTRKRSALRLKKLARTLK